MLSRFGPEFSGVVNHKKVPTRTRDTNYCGYNFGNKPLFGFTSHRLVRRRNEVGMNPNQYRLNAADFLSLASKAGDSCQTSHFIDMALYWFNMAEKVETGARVVLSETGLAA